MRAPDRIAPDFDGDENDWLPPTGAGEVMQGGVTPLNPIEKPKRHRPAFPVGFCSTKEN